MDFLVQFDTPLSKGSLIVSLDTSKPSIDGFHKEILNKVIDELQLDVSNPDKCNFSISDNFDLKTIPEPALPEKEESYYFHKL